MQAYASSRLTSVLLLAIATCTTPVLSSAYYDNAFFTRITKQEVDTYWNDEVDAHSYIKGTYACDVVHK